MAFPWRRGEKETSTGRFPTFPKDYDSNDEHDTKDRVRFPLPRPARRSLLDQQRSSLPAESSSAPVSTEGDERGREKDRSRVKDRVGLRSSSMGGGINRRGRLSLELRRAGVEGMRKYD